MLSQCVFRKVNVRNLFPYKLAKVPYLPTLKKVEASILLPEKQCTQEIDSCLTYFVWALAIRLNRQGV